MLLLLGMLLALPSAAQDPDAIDDSLPPASIVDSWTQVHSWAKARSNPMTSQPLHSAWEGSAAPSQHIINTQVERVLQKAVKAGPKDDVAQHGSDVRGREGSQQVVAWEGSQQVVAGSKDSGVGTEVKSTDATTYVVYKNGRVYLSEKPLKKTPAVIVETHAQKMLSMAHAKMDAIAKKDKTFAETLHKEAKQLAAAGMAAEGKVCCVIYNQRAHNKVYIATMCTQIMICEPRNNTKPPRITSAEEYSSKSSKEGGGVFSSSASDAISNFASKSGRGRHPHTLSVSHTDNCEQTLYFSHAQ